VVGVGSEHDVPAVRHDCWKKSDCVELMRRRTERIRDTTFILQLIRLEYTFTHRYTSFYENQNQ